MSQKQDPPPIQQAAGVPGHITPMLQITKELVARQHDVFFIGSKPIRDQVERSGATHIPSIGPINFDFASDLWKYPDFLQLKPGTEQLTWFYVSMANWMPSGLESVRSALSRLRWLDPNREVVMICEAMFGGILPLKLGAELPDGYTTLPKTLGISVVPAFWTSIDTGTVGFGLTPDNSPAEFRARLDHTLREICGAPTPLDSIYGEHAKIIYHNLFDSTWACHDTILQMCIPPLELPRSDWPANFKFGGTLPPKALPEDLQYPQWWEDIVANEKKQDDRKKVVMVGQGTVAQDYEILVQPTLRLLADRSDLIVIVVLGVKSATLDPSQPLPSNARFIDYFPYDAILPHVDVFVVTGGYGSLQHAATNGVPMVLAEDGEDKADVALRGEVAGIAFNMRTGRPAPEAISQAVDTVLGNPSYKARALELKQQVENFNAIDVVERELLALLD